MMAKMLSNPHVFFVGAYRGDEVQQGHMLHKALDTFRSVTKVQSIVLDDLDVKSLNKICAKSLRSLSEAQSMPLSQFIHSMTNGNPMLFVCFFTMLEKEKCIWFDASQDKWTWDIDQIKRKTQSLSISRDGLIADKIRRLSTRSQQIAQIAW